MYAWLLSILLPILLLADQPSPGAVQFSGNEQACATPQVGALNATPIIATETIEWLDSTEHDFGDLDRDQPVDHYFRFTNHSEETITIDNIRVTCGCTAPDWSALPIPPGATDSIKITYDAHKTGFFSKKIKVYFSHQRKAEVLYVLGYVMTKEESNQP